jgi:hypothetical protein
MIVWAGHLLLNHLGNAGAGNRVVIIVIGSERRLAPHAQEPTW